MPRVLVAYTTYDRHKARIAESIAATLRYADCAVEVCDLARSRPEPSLKRYNGVIAGGPLHGGDHPPRLVTFASKNRAILNTKLSAFLLVRQSAARNDEQSNDAMRCLDEFLEEAGWKPIRSTIVAGAPLYREYGCIKRWMMKRIASGRGGDTDTSRNYVYTDWEALAKFAHELVRDWSTLKSVLRESALE